MLFYSAFTLLLRKAVLKYEFFICFKANYASVSEANMMLRYWPPPVTPVT